MTERVHDGTGCTGKRRFVTRTAAKAQQRSNLKRGQGRLHLYRCVLCAGWHVSSVSGSRSRQDYEAGAVAAAARIGAS